MGGVGVDLGGAQVLIEEDTRIIAEVGEETVHVEEIDPQINNNSEGFVHSHLQCIDIVAHIDFCMLAF